MNICFRRILLVAGMAMTLAGCGDKQTNEALKKAQALEDQKEYQEANAVMVDALQVREQVVRANIPLPTDAASANALAQKVQADPEILKLERAQVLIYLHLERADLASAVYGDILSGHPGDTVVDDALKDPDPLIRTGAVRILGLTGKIEAIPALAGATKDEDKDVRRAAVAALGSIKDPTAVDPLIAALKDPYWFVRSEAASALGRQGDLRAIKPLIDTVPDSDSTVESSAEASLLQLAPNVPEIYTEEFAGRLNDTNPKVVMIAVACLAVLKDPRAVPVLLKLLASPDPTTRLQALKGLGIAGDPSVIPILRRTLNDPDENMRGWAIIGLSSLKDTDSIPTLTDMENDATQPPAIRAAAKVAVDHLNGQPTDPAPNP